MSCAPSIVLGTRTSDLALWQTNHIIEQLQLAWPGLQCERMPFITKGDRTQAEGKPLPAIGGKGLFTAELEASLRSGQIDLAVHSLKDLPVEDSPGLTIGAITNRADVRDALVARNSWTLSTLPIGAVVGTSSTRRAAQLRAHRPDLTIRSIRGNVPTRVRKVLDGEYDATLLAVAGLERLDLMAHVTEILPLEIMLPAPGQGALAVQCRANDQETLALLAAIDDPLVRSAVNAERTFLHALGGGCSAPVAAYAYHEPHQVTLHLATLVAATDGQSIIRIAKSSNQPSTTTDEASSETATFLGNAAANEATKQGADKILAESIMTISSNAPSAVPSVRSSENEKLLAGKRIVVTRAAAQAEPLAAALANLGAIPLLIPTIRIEPLADLSSLDRALQKLEEYQWMVFTSVNGVEIVAERLAALGLTAQAIDSLQVAAVGSSTAQALRAKNIEATFTPARYVAEAIVDGLGNIDGQRILLPQAEIARETLATRLTARGAIVNAIPIYQTLPAPLDGVALAELTQGVDLLTFTSSSTVENLFAALEQAVPEQSINQSTHDMSSVETALAKLAALANPAIACIGPVTAETVRSIGVQVDIVATEHTISGLVDAIVAYYQQNLQQ